LGLLAVTLLDPELPHRFGGALESWCFRFQLFGEGDMREIKN
jgi:hypothetical protein